MTLRPTMLLLAMLAAASAVTAQRAYPLYMQCDPRWGNDQMGVDGPGERSTICGEGCAMSSLAMGLNGLGVPIMGEVATPKSFNKWLLLNNGYHCDGGDCNNLVLNAVERLTPRVKFVSELPPQSIATIEAGLTSGDYIYVAHVRNRHHFVILTGASSNHSGFQVNDPMNYTQFYPYQNISDVLLFKVLPAAEETLAPVSPVTPRHYPLFKQCNASWGADVMTHQTICQVGCLMSSTAMALNGFDIHLPGGASTPHTLNAWLRANGGYVGDGLNEEVVQKLNPQRIVWPADGMHRTNDLSLAQVQSYLKRGRIMIANVRNGGHFVLATGWDTDASRAHTIYVNDPGFNVASYNFQTEIMGWRIFDLK